MRVTRPATGVRFMWTSIGDRKMVICCQSPGGAQRPSVGPAIITRPSAGDTTRPGVLRHLPLGIAEEIGEEAAERGEAARPAVPPRGAQAGGRHQRGGDERNSGAIDFHDGRMPSETTEGQRPGVHRDARSLAL